MKNMTYFLIGVFILGVWLGKNPNMMNGGEK